MAKKSSKAKCSDQSSIKSAATSRSSVSCHVASAVEKAKSILRPSKKMKPTPSTRSGSSTAIPLTISDDEPDDKIAESIHSGDSSPVDLIDVDPEKELGIFPVLFHTFTLI